MKTHSLIASLASLGLSTLVAGSAQATMVAGWDFAQYVAATLLSTDGANFINTLPADYSDVPGGDPNGAGVESAAFGTMLMDGSATSTNVNPDPSANPPFIPTTDSLLSNFGAPDIAGDFDQHTILMTEDPSLFPNFLSMTATGALSVVFQADLGSVAEEGEDWVLTFGGKTFSGNATVGVSVSSNGTSYAAAFGGGSVNLSPSDTPFTVVLTNPATDTLVDTLFVRLDFAAPGAGGLNQAIIDNVAINASLVPEPGTVGLFLAGLLGLARFQTKRN